MRAWMYVFLGLLLGVVTGFVIGRAEMLPFDMDVRTVEFPDKMQEAFVKLGAKPIPTRGIRISGNHWNLYLTEESSRNFLVATGREAARPMLIVEHQGSNSGMERFSFIDSMEQMISAEVDEESEVSRLIAMVDQGGRVAYVDEEFQGNFSRRMRLDEPKGMWGNFSDGNWVALWQSEDGLFAERDDDWAPARLEGGKYIFDDKGEGIRDERNDN